LVAGKADPAIRMPHEWVLLPENEVQLIEACIDQGEKNKQTGTLTTVMHFVSFV
jgi:hypothetical protein